MLNFNLFENIDFKFKCFCRPDTKEDADSDNDDLGQKIYDVGRKYNIFILPVLEDQAIDNLYPTTDHVHLWNIFIVGNDKTYILATVNDDHIRIPNHSNLANHKSDNMIPPELTEIFNTIWDKTLRGSQLQFYMVWNKKLYFINTYPFSNDSKKVIGAIMFMRAFETLPETRFVAVNGQLVPIRPSFESMIDSCTPSAEALQ